MILSVFDYDDGVFDSTDDLIGRAVIHLRDVEASAGVKHLSFNDEIPYPAWHPVKRHYDDEFEEETGAAILVSIQIKELDEEYAVPALAIQLNRPPPMIGNKPLLMPDLDIQEFKTEITALGLRDLVSTGLLPVNKAYIKFAVKSLVPVA